MTTTKNVTRGPGTQADTRHWNEAANTWGPWHRCTSTLCEADPEAIASEIRRCHIVDRRMAARAAAEPSRFLARTALVSSVAHAHRAAHLERLEA